MHSKTLKMEKIKEKQDRSEKKSPISSLICFFNKVKTSIITEFYEEKRKLHRVPRKPMCSGGVKFDREKWEW